MNSGGRGGSREETGAKLGLLPFLCITVVSRGSETSCIASANAESGELIGCAATAQNPFLQTLPLLADAGVVVKQARYLRESRCGASPARPIQCSMRPPTCVARGG